MKQITAKTQSKSYPVRIERGGIAKLEGAWACVSRRRRPFFLSSPRVWRHWGGAVQAGAGPIEPWRIVLFDDAERAKNLRTVEGLARRLASAGADRHSVIVALGGGVVGDVAGFVAATYMRGVRLVHVPTTLVAQVDSAIGGKTGVNLPEGKNLVGAFYQPDAVLVDPLTLRTLPLREYRSGLYEVIKYGVLGDARLFNYVQRHLAALLAQKPRALEWVLARCIRAKTAIVRKDERESGLREALNLGHTFAHALEAATNYRTFLHGEAVAWGLLAAAELALRQGLLPASDAQRVARMVRSVGTIPAWPARRPESLMRLMKGDKKAQGGILRFVLPVGIGKVQTGVEAPEKAVIETLQRVAEGSCLR